MENPKEEYVLVNKFLLLAEIIAIKHGLTKAVGEEISGLVSLAFAAGVKLTTPEHQEPSNVIELRRK